MYGPRDRYIAQLVVARGALSHERVLAIAARAGALVDPGTLSAALVSAGLIDSALRDELELAADRACHACSCGEVFYASGSGTAPCPRCAKPVVPAPPATALTTAVDEAKERRSDPAPAPAFGEAPGGGAAPPRSHLGPYEILGELGRGGMGVVYRARQASIRREVALKCLLEARGKRRERFLREARAAAKLEHPNIVRIHDVGEDEGVVYYVMDLLKGRPLDRVLEDERALPVDRALAIMEPLARAVACVHEAGIIHRDLKPANVFLDESGGPVLIDFGLARALDDADNLTRTGAAVGTPSYMSPEQVRGIRSEVDERTDVWALGVLLFEMVSGERPFTGDNAPVLYARIQTEDAPPLRQVTSGVSLALEAIVAKALERDRQRRYAKASELADDIARVRRGEVPFAMAAGERLVRASRRAQRTIMALAVLGALGSAALAAAVGLGAVATRNDRATREKLAEEDRALVEKSALALVAKLRSRAAEAVRCSDGGQAFVMAEEALSGIEGLRATLASRVSTEEGRRAAVAQTTTPEALAALREAFVAHARAALRRAGPGDLVLAANDLARAREGAQKDAEIAALAAETFLALERPEDADRALAPALAAHPDDATLVRLSAEARLLAGDPRAALSALSRADDPAALLVRARACLLGLDATSALAELDRFAKTPGSEKSQEAPLILLEASIALGKLDEAEALASDLGRARPDDPASAHALARVATARGDDEGAVRILSRALQRHPDDERCLAARARARVLIFDDDGAVSDFRVAAEHASVPRRRAALRVELATFLSAISRGEEASAELEHAVACVPDDARARTNVRAARSILALTAQLGSSAPPSPGADAKDAVATPLSACLDCLLALGRKDGAAALEAALSARASLPRDPLAATLETRARSLRGEGDLSTLLREAAILEESSSDTPGLLVRRATSAIRFAWHFRSERSAAFFELARREAERAAALAPFRAAPIAIAAAAMAATRGDPSLARLRMNRALELDREVVTVALCEGHLRLLEGAGNEAAVALDHACALSTDDLAKDAVTLLAIGVAMVRAGKAPEAERVARRAYELDPLPLDSIAIRLDAARISGDEALLKQWQEEMQAAIEATRRADALLDRGEGPERFQASALYEEAARIAPRYARAWRLVCTGRFRSGEPVGAWRAFARAIELEPYDESGRDLESRLYRNSAKLRAVMSPDEFARELERRATADPRAPELEFLLGYTEWCRSEIPGEGRGCDLSRAHAHFDRAIALDPRFGMAYALRGHIRRLRGQIETARDDFQRARVCISGRAPLVRLLHAGLLASIGDSDGAVAQLQEARKEGLDDKPRVLRDPALAKIAVDPRMRAILDALPEQPAAANEDF